MHKFSHPTSAFLGAFSLFDARETMVMTAAAEEDSLSFNTLCVIFEELLGT
jgi:hypothetical protein